MLKNVVDKIFSIFNKCKFSKLWSRITGEQGRKDWARIQELVIKELYQKKMLRKYKEFWEHSHEAFLLLKAPDGKIIDANPAACSLYGYTKEQITKLLIFDLSAEPECTQQTYDSKIQFVPYRYHKNVDGTEFLVCCSLTYFLDNGDGEIASLIVRRIEDHRSSEGYRKDRKIK